MTAPQPARGSDSVRAQIAQLLLNTSLRSPHPPNSGAMALEQADVLVPLVDGLRAEAKAEALESMADWTIRTGYADAAVLREFRDRAAASRTNPSEETDRG